MQATTLEEAFFDDILIYENGKGGIFNKDLNFESYNNYVEFMEDHGICWNVYEERKEKENSAL